jgi:hypothetical protein
MIHLTTAPTHTHALQACKALASKKGGAKPKDNGELATLAAGKLRASYKAAAPEHLPIVDAVLAKLQ